MHALLLTFLLASNQVNAVEVRGMPSCGTWVKDRRDGEVNWAHLTNISWLIGFLSGLASATGRDALTGTNNDSIVLWMDNFCQANPLKDIEDGGTLLFIELAKKRGV